MPTNVMTDAKCRAAKPGQKLIKLFDGGGLFLAVLPSGAKTWRVAYRLDGVPKTKSFGPYPDVSLAEARRLRDELKATLRAGGDPMAGKRVKKGISLQEASDTYWGGRADLSPSYVQNAQNGIAQHLARLLHRNVADITRDDLLAELKIMDEKSLYVYVRRVRMWVGQVLDWAVENGLAGANVAKSINPEKAFGRAKVESFAALELRDVPEFMRRLEFEGSLQSVLACKLLALTWTRTVELRKMEWAEVDFDQALWLIPETRMKRQKEHLVPLSRQALAILRELQTRSVGCRFVFPGGRDLKRPMSENAILYLIGRIGYQGRLTGHGFRSIASTWANERGFNPDAIERQLAHVPENKIRAIYNRAAYLPERAQMLQDYADWLLPVKGQC